MKNAAKAVTACTLVIAGLVGLYFKVEYSGWVIFVGALVAVSLTDD